MNLIFDIGFNEGNFTREMKRLYPNSRIIGLDGHPIYLEKFNYNKIDNVVVYNAVVSDKYVKELDFHICDCNIGINSINPDWIEKIRHKKFFDATTRTIKIPSVTIDLLIEKFGTPDLIKLDIEGSESLALAGLSKKVGVITFEWSEDYIHDALKCINKLKQLGYTKFAFSENQEDYVQFPDYKNWEDLNFLFDVDVLRKERWGMMYVS